MKNQMDWILRGVLAVITIAAVLLVLAQRKKPAEAPTVAPINVATVAEPGAKPIMTIAGAQGGGSTAGSVSMGLAAPRMGPGQFDANSMMRGGPPAGIAGPSMATRVPSGGPPGGMPGVGVPPGRGGNPAGLPAGVGGG